MIEHYKQLGEYTLTRKIGSGGMADVWLAERSLAMGARKTVAVKLLNAVSREKQDYRRMFLDEARLSTLLNHSSIVHVFDAGECDGECFMAMEYVDGINLSQLDAMLWERDEKLPIHVATYIAGEVLRALDHAHNLRTHESASIVHRDVSPQNVMLSVAGEVKLMDFGVARFASEETAGIHVKGKLRYMPPEQLQGQSREPTVDLFAVGAVLHEMIEGRRFRDEFDDLQLLPMILNGVVPPLSGRSELPPEVVKVIDGLLTADPRLRIGSARGALRMLTEWSGYRNAAIELESYVSRYRDLVPPPGPPPGTGASGNVQGRIEARAREISASGRDSSARRQAWRQGVNPATGATLDHLEGHTVADTDVGASWPSKSRTLTLLVAALVAACGLAVGGLSVALALNMSKDDEQQASANRKAESPQPGAELEKREQPSVIEPDARAVAQPPSAKLEASEQPPASPVTKPDPGPVQAQAQDGEPGGAPENFGDDEGDIVLEDDPIAETDEPEPEPEPPPPPKQKVEVRFLAHEHYYVQVKVSGHELTLPPAQAINLLEGRHTIHMRTEKDAPWQRIGRERFRPGHSYRVLMTKPAGVKVVEVD